MRIHTEETKLYKWSELDDDQREMVLDKNRDHLADDDCLYHVVEEFKDTIGPLFGLYVSNVYYSGFWSQGDGACFEGSFEYRKGMLRDVKAWFPSNKELIGIAEQLQYVQRKAFYRLNGSIRHRGHYSHSGCTEFTVYNGDYSLDSCMFEDDIKSIYRDLMNWLYAYLEAEYEYTRSDDTLSDYFSGNDYEFTEDGEIH